MLLSYFDNKNSGPVILFIHGTAASRDIWDKQFNYFKKSHYRVIGIDLRGHGMSKDPGGICAIEDHINDLKETIDHLEVAKPITIIGHSFGAVLAAKFAENYPYYVEKLLLVSLPPKVPRVLIKYYKWLLGKPIEYLKKKLHVILKLPLKKKIKLAVCADLNIVRQIWRESIKWDFLNSIPQVNCPVYLSVGRFDYIALNNMVKKLHHELPNSSYKVFKWSAHTCMEDEPKEFNEWVASVLLH